MRVIFQWRRPGLWLQAGWRRYGKGEYLSLLYTWVAWCGPLRIKGRR